MASKTSLPGKIKARLNGWFEGSDGAGLDEETRKAALGEQIMRSMAESLQQLDENWSDERAAETREFLINAFTLMPRDKRVINAHIRYNSVAVQHGGQRHSPTTRTDV